MSDYESVHISFQVTPKMKKGLNDLAKEYNITMSEMMRILIVDVLPDQDDNSSDPVPRKYPRRKR
jgi:replication initiation and membrane attachment protein DnaB